MLSGARGEGAQFAMQMLVRVAEAFGARELIDIKWAHVASAYDQGQANLDLAKHLAASNTRVAVPTTLTACSLNLHGRGTVAGGTARELIELYESMGCDAVMTCAPYHASAEPRFGDHLAWSESSAVVYANSVLGARSNRYVEFVDMCAAVTGRVPDCGLHRSEHRRATMLFRIGDIPADWLTDDWFYHVLGILIGAEAGAELPAILGLPAGCTVEQLRALGSAAATSGPVSMFHAIGVTPEAASLDSAFQDGEPVREFVVDAAWVRRAAADLSRSRGEPLTAICVGAPHLSYAEFEGLQALLDGRTVSPAIKLYAATSSAVLHRLEQSGIHDSLRASGVEFVVGRCTYYRPAMPGTESHVMTNSAKWAYYAPSGLGASVTFASLAECIESACAGRVILNEER